MTPSIQVGQVLRIPESHYLYGLGELRLRVTKVGSVQRLPDGDWLRVVGVQLGRDGSELREREVLVRVSGVRREPGG